MSPFRLLAHISIRFLLTLCLFFCFFSYLASQPHLSLSSMSGTRAQGKDDWRSLLADMRAHGGDSNDDETPAGEAPRAEKPSMLGRDDFITAEDIVQIDNPNLARTLREFPITRGHFAEVQRALDAWERIHPDEDKEGFLLSELLPAADMDEDRPADEDDNMHFFAPATVVIAIVLPFFIAFKVASLEATTNQLSDQTEATQKLVEAMKASKALKVEDMNGLRAVVAGLFYSGSSPGYGCGNKDQPGQSRVVEAAAVDLFRVHPGRLGANGKELVRPGCAEGERAIRNEVKAKLDSLRSTTKWRLWASMGHFGGQPQSLLELARWLYGHYRLPVTPDRLYRLAWLRSIALQKKAYIEVGTKEDGTTAWESNKKFWDVVDASLQPWMAAYNNPDEREEVVHHLKGLFRQDKKRYGDYDFAVLDLNLKDNDEEIFDTFLHEAALDWGSNLNDDIKMGGAGDEDDDDDF
ncbi:hypothetical protein V8E36_002604 [Tilletia maclaganii]